ncbi:MAG: EAL domain-containing protein [Desulfobacterales bacterium]|nr:EAL domain-containing protein [Desulfobacterales bacterium]
MPVKWILEGYFGTNQRALQRIPLYHFPSKVGRDPGLSLAIVRAEVSRVHAEFFESDGKLMLRDFDSTNGTFVNHQQLKGEISLRHGDVVHFASYEVRVLQEMDDSIIGSTEDDTLTMFNYMPLGTKLPTGLNELQVLLDKKAVSAMFQPIVGLDSALYGYEVLGRGGLSDLPVSPLGLFRIAESMPGKDAELSELMRDVGVEQAYAQSSKHRIFMNTHPAELKNTDHLLLNIRRLRERFPDLPMVMEIHEDAITDVSLMEKVGGELVAMDVELAYDDFGAGQARLMEMIEIPVKYVKFDMALIRGLHNAPESKQKMVAALAAMTKTMGILALAEGVEAAEELDLCKQMNFDLVQGYYFGKPDRLLNYKNPLA